MYTRDCEINGYTTLIHTKLLNKENLLLDYLSKKVIP